MNPQQRLDFEVAALLVHLFQNVFCPAEEISDDRKGEVLPVYFLGWLDQQVPLLDRDEILHAANVSSPAWDRLLQVLGSAAGVEMIAPLWYSICLAHHNNPPPQHELTGIVMNVLFQFSDGTYYAPQVHVSREMLQGPGFRDSTVATILADKMRLFVREIVEKGIDGCHDCGVNYGGDYPFEVLMGMILQGVSQLKPEVQENVRGYMRMFQGMVRPAVPPEIREQIETRKRATGQPQQQSKIILPGDGPRGGFG